jgi:hypothetical protein
VNELVAATLQRLREERLTLQAEGCSEADISALERAINAPLPSAYREFLLAIGRDWGEFMVGSDRVFEDLSGVNRYARHLVAETGASFPPSAFAFLGHQGYQFLCFFLRESEDPQVHHFMEGEALKPLGMRFSEWLRMAADDEITIRRDLDGNAGRA